MNYDTRLSNYFAELQKVLSEIDVQQIRVIADKLNAAMKNDQAIYIFGNGGGSALASHFCADVGKMLKLDRNENYRIFALTDNVPTMTAWANDSDYSDIFWRQLELYMRKGDLVFALSGSGNSPNVIKAVEFAKTQGGESIALAGFSGGKLAQVADNCYVVPSSDMQIAEDLFGIILHAIFVALRDC